MKFFEDLGSLVEGRWRDVNYDERAFPEIAAQALAETNPNRHQDPWDIIRWLHTTPQLPSQRDVEGRFGNPPITLYCSPRFHIDVYFWLDGTTSIHQHAFSGAFQVLLGSSVHSRYSFEHEQHINSHFSIGQVCLNSAELLAEGDIRTILPGRQFIHSLFHLDRPSATVTIRTYQTPDALPQYDFLKPYIALDSSFKDESTIKKVQSVILLLAMKHPEADSFTGDLVSCSDFQTSFLALRAAHECLTTNALQNVFHLNTGEERFHALLQRARSKHGHLVDVVLPVISETRRQQDILNRRTYMTTSEHRFFLALLLNVPHRTNVLELVKRRFRDRDPVDIIADWVMELSTTRLLGSREPNVLGVDGLDDEHLFVVRCLLEGLSREEVKEALRREYYSGQEGNLEGEYEALFNSLQSSTLLSSLLFDSRMPSIM
jgi:hypothetical protein